MQLHVENIAAGTSPEDLQRLFSAFGEVERINLIAGPREGFAEVSMPDETEALAAVEQLNRVEFCGRVLAVSVHRSERVRQRIRLLLADDHRVVRSALRAMLEKEEELEIVAEADDGPEAVELAQQRRPDVVVMDVTMPRLSGVEATRQILQLLPGTQIIGLSMHESDAMGQAMREAGACDYLPKDRAAEELISAIRRSVGREAA